LRTARGEQLFDDMVARGLLETRSMDEFEASMKVLVRLTRKQRDRVPVPPGRTARYVRPAGYPRVAADPDLGGARIPRRRGAGAGGRGAGPPRGLARAAAHGSGGGGRVRGSRGAPTGPRPRDSPPPAREHGTGDRLACESREGSAVAAPLEPGTLGTSGAACR